MTDFLDHEYDVLVTTAIIESGLDMPRVNTIIIDRADRFGLAQLYQLRGRVGRSNHRAFAYLMTPPGERLTAGGAAPPGGPGGVPGPGLGLPHRHARPGDPRRRQPAGRGAARPHGGHRLRPLLPPAGGNRGGTPGRRRCCTARREGRTAAAGLPARRLRGRSPAEDGSLPPAGPDRAKPGPATGCARSSGTATGRCRRPVENLLAIQRLRILAGRPGHRGDQGPAARAWISFSLADRNRRHLLFRA